MSNATSNSETVARVLEGPVTWSDGGIGRLVLLSNRQMECQAWNYRSKSWMTDDFSMETLITMGRTATRAELAEAGVPPN